MRASSKAAEEQKAEREWTNAFDRGINVVDKGVEVAGTAMLWVKILVGVFSLCLLALLVLIGLLIAA